MNIKTIKFPWLDRANGSSHNIKLGDTWVHNEYNGLLDDFTFHNRALTKEEITNISSKITSGTCHQTISDTTHITVYDTVAVEDTLMIKTIISGINNTTINHLTKVYPNPAKGFANFDFTNYSDLNGYSLKIINNVSQEVYSTEITQQKESVELSSLGVKGLYFIQILNANNELFEVRKLLIE